MNKWIVMLTAMVLGAGGAQAATIYGYNTPPIDGQWNTATNWWHLPTSSDAAYFRGDNLTDGVQTVNIDAAGGIAGAIYFSGGENGEGHPYVAHDITGVGTLTIAPAADMGPMIRMYSEVQVDQTISADVVLTSQSDRFQNHIVTYAGGTANLILSGHVSQSGGQGIGIGIGDGNVVFSGTVDGSSAFWNIHDNGGTTDKAMVVTGSFAGDAIFQVGATVRLNNAAADSSTLDVSYLRLVGGELALMNDHQLADTEVVGFAATDAGTFNLDGNTDTIGGLQFETATDAGSLDMGLDGVLRLSAQDSAAVWGDLTVLNWTEGSDHIYVDGGSFSSSQLANITFDGYAAGAQVVGGELVAIPEPATLGLLGGCFAGMLFVRRRLMI